MNRPLEARLDVITPLVTYSTLFERQLGKGWNTVSTLRRIKLFLHKTSPERRKIFEGTLLDSTDCLTYATLAHLIAKQQNVTTQIARPKQLHHYFHALILYEHNGAYVPFKVTGSERIYSCAPMSDEIVERRLRYVRPIVNAVNQIRGI